MTPSFDCDACGRQTPLPLAVHVQGGRICPACSEKGKVPLPTARPHATESHPCGVCRRELNEVERAAPVDDYVGKICNACRCELEVAAKRAESDKPIAEAVLSIELRQLRRESAELRNMVSQIRRDASSTRAWVLFMGILTLIGLIMGILGAIGRAFG